MEQPVTKVKELLGNGSVVDSPSPAWTGQPSFTDTKSPVVDEIKGCTVKLRDHPSMTRKSSVVSWPPQWQCVSHERPVIHGELGVLEDVSMHYLISNKIFIAMDHLSERYITVLAFDDKMFARQLYALLTQQIGRSIREIGDLDLSHLL
jgi:hypothetical protein